MKYQTQINATEPDQWQTVTAPDMRSAAVKALNCAALNANALPCTVYVGDPRPKLQHDNRTPMIVHAFRIEKAEPDNGLGY